MNIHSLAWYNLPIMLWMIPFKWFRIWTKFINVEVFFCRIQQTSPSVATKASVHADQRETAMPLSSLGLASAQTVSSNLPMQVLRAEYEARHPGAQPKEKKDLLTVLGVGSTLLTSTSVYGGFQEARKQVMDQAAMIREKNMEDLRRKKRKLEEDEVKHRERARKSEHKANVCYVKRQEVERKIKRTQTVMKMAPNNKGKYSDGRAASAEAPTNENEKPSAFPPKVDISALRKFSCRGHDHPLVYSRQLKDYDGKPRSLSACCTQCNQKNLECRYSCTICAFDLCTICGEPKIIETATVWCDITQFDVYPAHEKLLLFLQTTASLVQFKTLSLVGYCRTKIIPERKLCEQLTIPFLDTQKYAEIIPVRQHCFWFVQKCLHLQILEEFAFLLAKFFKKLWKCLQKCDFEVKLNFVRFKWQQHLSHCKCTIFNWHCTQFNWQNCEKSILLIDENFDCRIPQFQLKNRVDMSCVMILHLFHPWPFGFHCWKKLWQFQKTVFA